VGASFLVKAARIGSRHDEHHVKIYLPVKIARKLNIRTGDTLRLTLRKKTIYLTKAREGEKP